ncbi:DinB family protein [Cytobacillus solani]|uniref:Formate dehydrogenase n=1 Tax=Cytobacillus solani TaxID=1637975 RepID=A0A0Q3TXG0_9BACI|nr:DinB family protein [Cytobacillus solani]KOP78835.1 formate dehydrogenase [Bacillus sp. FJAT-21945]KQL27597.1 formate dehydrogenase [Cytobacillus solani]
MSELLFKNMELTRGFFLKSIAGLNEEIVDVQPEGFNNTIKWHIGHVLTSAEQFMFGYPKKTTSIPANYMELFATGTKPSDWQGEVPSVSELTAQLKDQLMRMKEIPAERFSEKLPTPFLGQETFGEISNFSLFHESIHLGQIQAMKRVIEAAKTK